MVFQITRYKTNTAPCAYMPTAIIWLAPAKTATDIKQVSKMSKPCLPRHNRVGDANRDKSEKDGDSCTGSGKILVSFAHSVLRVKSFSSGVLNACSRSSS